MRGGSNLGLEVTKFIKIQLMIIILRSHDEFMIIVVLVAAAEVLVTLHPALYRQEETCSFGTVLQKCGEES